ELAHDVRRHDHMRIAEELRRHGDQHGHDDDADAPALQRSGVAGGCEDGGVRHSRAGGNPGRASKDKIMRCNPLPWTPACAAAAAAFWPRVLSTLNLSARAAYAIAFAARSSAS